MGASVPQSLLYRSCSETQTAAQRGSEPDPVAFRKAARQRASSLASATRRAVVRCFSLGPWFLKATSIHLPAWLLSVRSHASAICAFVAPAV